MIKYIAFYSRSVLAFSCSGHGKLFLQHRIWLAWNVDTSSVPPVGLITLLPKSWTRAWDKPFHVPPMVVIYLLMMPQSCKSLSQTCYHQNFVLVYDIWFTLDLDLLGHLSLIISLWVLNVGVFLKQSCVSLRCSWLHVVRMSIYYEDLRVVVQSSQNSLYMLILI